MFHASRQIVDTPMTRPRLVGRAANQQNAGQASPNAVTSEWWLYLKIMLAVACVGSGAWLLACSWRTAMVLVPSNELTAIEPGAGKAIQRGGRDGDQMPDLVAVASRELEMRTKTLDLRERDLEVREAALQALALKLQAEVAELEEAWKVRDAAKADDLREGDERTARLARLYENMKPKRAASIFDQTPVESLALIARHMRDGKAALIIQQMSPDRASELSAKLAMP